MIYKNVLLLYLFTVTFLGQSFGYSIKPSGYCDNAIELKTSTDLDSLIRFCSESKLVLLGESTHGTAEFYFWRSEISKRLISEKDFRFIVVEGDWASIYKLNLYVKELTNEFKSANEVLQTFNRWPEWMWANKEVERLVEWLKKHNESLPKDKKVGFYGMDVYGQWEAMSEVLRIAKKLIPNQLEEIQKQYDCYSAYNFDEWQYAMAVQRGYPNCNEGLGWVVEILKEHIALSSNPSDKKLLIHAKQSAKVVQNSEDYFRLAVRNSVTSWNSRVMHMHETVTRLLKVQGSNAKGIIWAHNTHIGDARATSMAAEGMYNIGQLSRQVYGENYVKLIGFTTYKGKVNAGSQWGNPMAVMSVPKAMKGSAESVLNKCELPNFYTIFDTETRKNDELLKPIAHRAIGVVYNPLRERDFNYVPSILPLRYDALVFIKTTTALEPVN
jgi:erythromycin esterase